MSKIMLKRTIRKYLKQIKNYRLTSTTLGVQFKMLQKLIRQAEIANLNYDEIY